MSERFGVTVDWRGATIEAIAAIAKQADDSRYGYFFVPEAWGLEAFSTVGYLLAQTKTVRIGTGVANVFSRSAATIASAAATLDQIAPGRFFLGLGTSGSKLIEGWHGIKFEKPLLRTKEYVDVIRAILKGGEARYDGEFLKLAKFRLYTAPLKREVEIYIGAIGEKNLALSSRVADGAIVALYPISKLGDCARSINQTSQPKKLFAYLPFRIAKSQSSKEAARMELSKYVAFYIRSMGKYYAQNLSELGFETEVEKVKSSEDAEIASRAVEGILDEFCLIGSPAEILERVSNLPRDVHPVFGLDGKSAMNANWLSELASEIQH